MPGTIDQRLSETAFELVHVRDRAAEQGNAQQNTAGQNGDEQTPAAKFKKYKSFAFSFPALIHTCGLMQAVVFAQIKAKQSDNYLKDFKDTIKEIEPDIVAAPEINNGNAQDNQDDIECARLIDNIRTADVHEYMRLSARALIAASWLKRWCQALGGDEVD